MEESFKKVFVLFVLCLLLVSQVSAQYFYDMGEKEPIPFRDPAGNLRKRLEEQLEKAKQSGNTKLYDKLLKRIEQIQNVGDYKIQQNQYMDEKEKKRQEAVERMLKFQKKKPKDEL